MIKVWSAWYDRATHNLKYLIQWTVLKLREEPEMVGVLECAVLNAKECLNSRAPPHTHTVQ
jgi:hypothetical protein